MSSPASIGRCWRSIRPSPDCAAGRPARARHHRTAQGDDRAAAGLYRADAAGAAARDHRPAFGRPRLAARHHRRQRHASCAQDGNTLDDKDERYARTNEFLDVVRAEWTSEKPFDYRRQILHGRKAAFRRSNRISPAASHTFVGGGSDAAIEVAGKHADTFALWGESYAQVRDVIGTGESRGCEASAGRRRASACRCGRSWPKPRKRPGPRPRRFWRAPPRCRTRPAIEGRPTAMRRPVRGDCWRWRSRAPDRQAAVDRNCQTDRRQQQYHRAGRNTRAGRRSVRRLLRSRHQPFPHSRFRSLDRRHRIWPRTDPADAQADCRTWHRQRSCGGMMRIILVAGLPPG